MGELLAGLWGTATRCSLESLRTHCTLRAAFCSSRRLCSCIGDIWRANQLSSSLCRPSFSVQPRWSTATLCAAKSPVFSLARFCCTWEGASSSWRDLSYSPILQSLRAGIWVFRCGSLSYFSASSAKLKVVWPTRRAVKIAALLVYMSGSVAYFVGGVLSEVGWSATYSASVWIVGGVCFVLGSIFNLVADVHDK